MGVIYLDFVEMEIWNRIAKISKIADRIATSELKSEESDMKSEHSSRFKHVVSTGFTLYFIECHT